MAFPRRFRPPVERTKQGFRLHLEVEERELLRRLLGELRALVTGPPDAPALRRLFPVAYHRDDDAERDAEYQRLMREELVASRLAALDEVEEALAEPRALDEAQLLALVRSINAVRLVLGTVLDLTEDHDPEEIDDDDPMVGEHHLYGYLSWLLEWSVRALSS